MEIPSNAYHGNSMEHDPNQLGPLKCKIARMSIVISRLLWNSGMYIQSFAIIRFSPLLSSEARFCALVKMIFASLHLSFFSVTWKTLTDYFTVIQNERLCRCFVPMKSPKSLEPANNHTEPTSMVNLYTDFEY